MSDRPLSERVRERGGEMSYVWLETERHQDGTVTSTRTPAYAIFEDELNEIAKLEAERDRLREEIYDLVRAGRRRRR